MTPLVATGALPPECEALADEMRGLKRARAFLFAQRQIAKQRGEAQRVASLTELLRLNKAAIVRLDDQMKGRG